MANVYSVGFNGSTQYGRKDNPANLNALTAFTIEAWFYVDVFNVTNGVRNAITAYGSRASTGEQALQLYILGNGTNCRLNGRVGFTSGGFEAGLEGATNLVASTWYHAAFTYDGSNIRLYLGTASTADVEDVATSALVGVTTNTPSHTSLYVGAMGITSETDIGDHLQAKIDEVRYWNTARTSAQINADRKRLLSGSTSGLVTYLRMEEGSGTSVNDETSSNNDLTLNNSPTWSTTVPFTTYDGGFGSPLFFGGGLTIG